MTARKKYWQLRETPPTGSAAVAGLSEILTALLYHRLYPRNLPAQEADEQFAEVVHHFLTDYYPDGLHDPFLLKGMDAASKRIAHAIAQGEQMAVYGDFDTDGVTAVSLLMQAIPAMGGNLRPYIPHRDREGYGLNIEAVEMLAAEGVHLLITVDCGITNVAEVERANELGMEVIVTDHHRPPPDLPPALAVVNPKQPDCPYPYKQLVGVGIAYKLVQALVKQGLRPKLRGRDMLDVVALGTIADMGPLDGENRVLVRAGIEAIHSTQRPGLLALIKAAGLKPERITSTDVGFMLGPRINAAGRIDDAVRAYELLLAQDFATAEQLAAELNTANRRRQELTRQVQDEALALAEQQEKHLRRIVVLDSADYPAGVVGLVAGKLVEQWARPVILISRGEEESRGSARSIPVFNIHQALTTCADLFTRFGGHSMAAGFSIPNRNLGELEARLQALADEQLTDEMLQPTLFIDAEVDPQYLTRQLVQELAQLEPFGQANHQPLFLSRNVQAVGVRTVGDGKHLKFRLDVPGADGRGNTGLQAIAFGLGALAEPLRKYPAIDIVYTLEENTWDGNTSLQLRIKDFRRVI
jgi:single-stranded-DNA-specific exonuclease